MSKAPEESLVDAAPKQHFIEFRAVLESNVSDSSKLEAVAAKFPLFLSDYAAKEREVVELRRGFMIMKQENDNCHQEAEKARASKTPLENLCRELQKQNKQVHDDARLLVDAEQQKRTELSQKFQSSLDEIGKKLELQATEHSRVAQENDNLRERLRSLLEKTELREQHFAQQLKMKDLEKQLAEARLKQETERLAETTKEARALTEKDTALSKQLAFYDEKFKELTKNLGASTELFAKLRDENDRNLGASTELFAKLRDENDRLTRMRTRLEGDNQALRAQAATLQQQLHDTQEVALKFGTEHQRSEKKLKALEELCRVLKAARNEALAECARVRGVAADGAAAPVPGGETAEQQSSPCDGELSV
ncbi:putative taxilin beta [Paratrimastix pyriformis]|uniref:Taxilin beta n=1 Tax=Paratrimastix pyriformis TaxID=342808 RepID=A0ABQ8U1V0_9EUKA|nr:putative taxilin beta [Paratrimastix pyriformis]